jgi:hypothetical protein
MLRSRRLRRRQVASAAGVFALALVAVACNPNGCAHLVQPPAPGPTNVLTYHNDNLRSGLNLGETILTPNALRSGRFHKLFTYPVDGEVYAQPLYVHGLDFGRGVVRNVVFIATMHNTVYAFDADHPAEAKTPIWQTPRRPLDEDAIAVISASSRMRRSSFGEVAARSAQVGERVGTVDMFIWNPARGSEHNLGAAAADLRPVALIVVVATSDHHATVPICAQ